MINRRAGTTVALAIVSLFPVCTAAGVREKALFIIMKPHMHSREVFIKLASYPDDTFEVQFPEVVSDNTRFLLGPEAGGFRRSDVEWRHLGDQSWVTSYTQRGIGEWVIGLKVEGDEIDINWTIRNLSPDEWHGVSATAHFSFDGDPDFVDPALERTYLRVEGRWIPIKDTDRSDGRASNQWYVPGGFRPPKLMGTRPHHKNSFGLSLTHPDNGLVAVVSKDHRVVVGQAFPKVQYICLNAPICFHPAPFFGNIDPGREATVHGKVYFIHGTLADFLRRYQEDFPVRSGAR